MNNFINKIKEFFKNLFSRRKIKYIEAQKENDLDKNQIKEKENYKNEKNEFFEIYNKIKNREYDINNLTVQQAEKVRDMLKSEIALKKDKLNHEITELNILKVDNRIDEKNRIIELYKGIKNEKINLQDIDKEDLLKVRKLLLEEAKIQDEKLGDEIRLLEIVKSNDNV